MDAATRRVLEEINRSFYRDHAAAFSATRGHPWPGWRRVVEGLPAPRGGRPMRILDVGCGNGRLAMFLTETSAGPLEYIGVDASAALLAEARRRHRSHGWAHFVESDFVARPPESALPSGPFDWIAIFGVMHHVPGFDRRRALIEAATALLSPGGRIALSLWRFAESERLRRRILAWEESGVAIDRAELEHGDHLLRWGSDNKAFRYCHHLDDAEWLRLCAGLPLREIDAFQADGASGRSNRYSVLERLDG